MVTKFWEGLGDKLSGQWVTTALAPAFVFWIGALGAWISRFGWKQLEMAFNQLPQLEQGALLIGGLLGIALSSLVIQRLDRPAIRLLEGYWPPWLAPLYRWGVRRQSARLDSAAKRYNELVNQRKQSGLNPDELKEYVRLDLLLRLAPGQPEQRMPTRLGNILRAAENRPLSKYGLNAIICWPRLWLLLPDEVKKELTEARANLDIAVRILLWGVLFIIWTIWAWWAFPLGLLVAIWAYRWALSAAVVYGDLLESAFDLHRFALYDMLRWPPPENSDVEKAEGERLTSYLFRGILKPPVKFKNPEAKKQEGQQLPPSN